MTTTTETVRVTGKTYDVREQLRAHGGVWDGTAWTLPASGWARLLDDATLPDGSPRGGNKRDRERNAAICALIVTDA